MKTDQVVVYPIIIRYYPDETDFPYLVTIPALNNAMTEATSIADAIAMADDLIGTFSLDDQLPPSDYVLPKASEGETVTLVRVNVSEYKRRHDNRVVRKSVTIPNYLNELGIENGINFSEVLTNAIKERLGE